MKKQQKSWYSKVKNRLHLDEKCNKAKAEKVVQPANIPEHKFFPFIHFQIKRFKLSKKLEQRENELSVIDPYKKRDIYYAGHLDSYIYSYYNEKLLEYYEKFLQDNYLKCSIAYRHIDKNNVGTGKSNIDFAAEAFKEIKNRKECYAIAMGVDEIKFSGGEPLLWKDIDKIINFISKNNIKTCIYTTGNVNQFNAAIAKLKENGLDRAIFSLFSAKKDNHEKITKKDGSYNNTISAIEKCVELGIKTEIHFVPMASNYKELPQIAWLGKRLGVTNISILRLVPQGRAKSQKDEILSKEQNKELRNIIVTLRNNGYNIRVGSPYNFLNLPDSKPCNSGTEELTIRPNLTICPCDAFKGVKPGDLGINDEYYSLEKHSLKECWEKSSFLNYIRSFSMDKFYKQCHNYENCHCGCLGQKCHISGSLKHIPDPMCLNTK